MPARFRGLVCDAASIWITAPMNFIFSEQTLSVHYFGRAVVDDDHESNYRFLFSISSLHSPLLPLNCEVMKVSFWRQDQFVFRKNDKQRVLKPKTKQTSWKYSSLRSFWYLSELLTPNSLRERSDERWNFRFEKSLPSTFLVSRTVSYGSFTFPL